MSSRVEWGKDFFYLKASSKFGNESQQERIVKPNIV